MDPGGINYSYHLTVPYYSRVSNSAYLCCIHIHLFLFLFHFSTTFLLLLVAPRVSECLGSSQECYGRLAHYGTKQGSFWAWSSPQNYMALDWCHFRLAPYPGPMVPVLGTILPRPAVPGGVLLVSTCSPPLWSSPAHFPPSPREY